MPLEPKPFRTKRLVLALIPVVALGAIFAMEVTGHIGIRAKSLLGNHAGFQEYYDYLQKFNRLDEALQLLRDDTKRSPYFGYTARHGNNRGMITSYNFPLTRNADDYYVGVFGASVAQHFSSKPAHFIQLLKEKLPALSRKNIKVVNFALGGYKQPQQYILFSFYFDQLDMAVQLDGWNEVFMSAGTEYPVDFPSDSAFFFSEDDDMYKSATLYVKLRSYVTKWSAYVSKTTILKYSATVFLATKATEQFLNEQANQIRAAGDREVKFPRSESGEEEIAIWSRYLKLQHILADGKKIPLFSFIQPSQYAKPGKKLTENELKCCFKPKWKPVAKFQLLREAGRELAKTTPRHLDLNDVFVGEEQEMYADDCCHLNEIGNKLLAQHMTDFIAAQIGRAKGSTHAKTAK